MNVKEDLREAIKGVSKKLEEHGDIFEYSSNRMAKKTTDFSNAGISKTKILSLKAKVSNDD
jgi:hypothetical protein